MFEKRDLRQAVPQPRDNRRSSETPPITSSGIDQTIYVGEKTKRETVADIVDRLVNPRARRF